MPTHSCILGYTIWEVRISSEQFRGSHDIQAPCLVSIVSVTQSLGHQLRRKLGGSTGHQARYRLGQA